MTRLGQSHLLGRAGFVALLQCAVCASARAAEPPPPPPPPEEQALELQLFQLDATVQNLPLQVAKTDTKVAEAPIVVEVITRQQMREWGYRTLAEVLQHMVGFYVEDDHILPNVAIRGISGGLFAESGLL